MTSDAELDCLLAMACSALDASTALIALTDGREIRSGTAPDHSLFASEPAFRDRMLASGQRLVVPDASLDDRFADSVSIEPRIGFYAGAPLFLDPGTPIGALSVFDALPRDVTQAHRDTLARIAGLLTTILRQRRDTAKVAELTHQVAAQADRLREHAAALAHSKKIFDRSSAVAKIGVWECDLLDNNSLRWTDGVYDLFELPRGSPLDRDRTVALYFPESRAEMERLRARAIRERGGFTLDARILTALGNERWMRLTADVESENGVPVRIFGMKQDITAEKALWDRARFLAEIDVMTGLANRSVFQATLSSLTERFGDRRLIGALLLLDLDGFKQVNDTFGHATGDECLKQVAARLRDVCSDALLVARIGGDEFGVLLGGQIDCTAAQAYAERIVDTLRLPIRWGERSFQLGASVGIAIPRSSSAQGAGASGADDLFIEADIALYAAKGKGKNLCRVFDPQMKSATDHRLETLRDIAGALEDGRLDLYYQPKMRLLDNRLSGFEALLRRHMPDGSVVAAGAFQAALEDPELSARLGNFVIEKALAQAASWNRAGLDFGNIAINLSAVQLHDRHFADKLIERIADCGLAPAMIEVEVTEGVFLANEPGPVKRILEQLKKTGMPVALDDFGTGYASLVHLRSYPIDVIKIDKSFVQRFLRSAQDRAILESILHLGASLGMDIVAEGIETTAQLESLKSLGCPLGQGFLFSRAIPAAQAVDWLTPHARERIRVA